MRPRLLPVLIAVAVLTLGMRVGELWQAFGEGGSGTETGGAAVASARAAEAEAGRTPLTPRQLAAAETGQSNGAESDGEANAAAADEPKGDGDVADPFAMSDEEIELLQQLAERREELDRRENELERRSELLKAAETRIQSKIEKLESLRETINGLLTQYDKESEQKVERLVKIYESMRPDDAAQIFEDLEMPVLLRVLGRMSERKSAPILAEMDAKKAQAVTLELAEQKDLPLPRE